MHRLIPALALVPLLFTAPAFAADPPFEEEPVVEVDNSAWDGFYTGIHLGVGARLSRRLLRAVLDLGRLPAGLR